ncbi:sulfite exporter TauE/SafE family protein [Nocardiopsis suaedae]|uniref:Probable membrane transporter protein n=1 Tax=Nocardiopsis suaedae TaxID=3018444 RepID=A0ABT4TG28_9ACTN|nr:sulfite exporter TauE/SafE family protein [Nocardiopsis suaedae]MDA2803658.1 sulfite exporter TauE/SafE family protein [Nocardiopsis suaedae]
MRTLVLLGIVGFLAQLVDGALGMAYGVTSTTLLLVVGANPASASATVHLAEIGTTLASGAAHWRLGNVDWPVVRRIALPGAVGAFAGATFLSRLSTEAAAPVMAGILLALGTYVLVRFTLRGARPRPAAPLRTRFLAPLGLVGGFVDATGGGGWGPVGTPALLASGRIEPRKVIGSVDTAEFLVTVAASAGFLLGLGTAGVDLAWAAVLLAGGVLAAPLAAWIVRHVPPRVLGSAVGGLIVLTNTRTLLGTGAVPALGGAGEAAVYGLVWAVWAAAVAWSVRAHLAGRRAERAAGRHARAAGDAESDQVGPLA